MQVYVTGFFVPNPPVCRVSSEKGVHHKGDTTHMIEKNKKLSGADETTPSHPQYFSWINNTNEGATEAQTLTNLAFFRYLREQYGMQLDIYAWDAGNLDGARGTYADFTTGKLAAQYPNGYKPCADVAREEGIRLGVWGGADGYGDTPAEENARRELIVSLCRDLGFGLFKFDTVCGSLRPEKRDAFAKTMEECRKYVPDLVLLNHRNNLGEAEVYATTFLWGGVETYVDVHICNDCTAPHHRGFIFERGHVPGLKRLTEDHGVCISSCIDYFEDDLVYQAFSRSLILAPEIYGNPWLMRDDELPVLANIYNLHRRYNEILVQGMILPDFMGAPTVSRGNDKRRFITTGNKSWQMAHYDVVLDTTIGLAPCHMVSVILHHPYTRFLGTFAYGERVEIPVEPFRACLVEICDSTVCDEFPMDCAYEVQRYDNGRPSVIKLIQTDKTVTTTAGRTLYTGNAFDNREEMPQYLGSAVPCAIPKDSERLYETTCYTLDSDTLEKRALVRSGETVIPEVQAARDAFFQQKTYILRGSDSEFLFDKNPDTFYDGRSKTYGGGLRIDGGCLRVDLGTLVDCDTVEIEYYATTACSTDQILPQTAPDTGEISTDLTHWCKANLTAVTTGEKYTMPYVRQSVHDIRMDEGVRMTAVYQARSMRYFRLPNPVDRIFAFRVRKNGMDVTPTGAKANNLMAAYEKRHTTFAQRVIVIPEKTGKLAVAVNGVHGKEGVYCGARMGDTYLGFPDRAPSYPSNVWEHFVGLTDGNTTHFLPVTADMVGQSVEIFVLYNGENHDCSVDVYLCADHGERCGVTVEWNDKE